MRAILTAMRSHRHYRRPAGVGATFPRPAISHISAAFLLLTLSSFAASKRNESTDDKPTDLPVITPAHRLPTVSLLPDGCVLRDAMIPRYDQNLKLTTVLRAKMMTLVDAKTIDSQSTSIEFYNPDRSHRARIDLKTARYDQESGVLRAHESVSIVSTDFHAEGTSLIYIFNSNHGYLYGPLSTVFQHPPSTAMHSPLKPAAAVLISTAMATSPVVADPPARLAQDEIHAIENNAAHSTAPDAARQQTDAELDADRTRSDNAGTLLQNFSKQAAVTINDQPGPPADKPLAITPSPEDTRVLCDDGMFFDTDKGILIYIKNVRLSDPRFTMTGADEMKIFLEKKDPPKTDKTKNPDNPATDGQPTDQKPAKPQADLIGGANASFGNVDHIVANGRILVTQKPADGKPPVEASAALLNYNAKTGEIILSGGYPWVRQGTTYMRSLEPNLNIRIQKDGSFATSHGHWESGGRPKDNQNQPAKNQPAKPATSHPSSH